MSAVIDVEIDLSSDRIAAKLRSGLLVLDGVAVAPLVVGTSSVIRRSATVRFCDQTALHREKRGHALLVVDPAVWMDVGSALRSGAVGLISHDEEPALLAHAVRAAVRGCTWLSPTLSGTAPTGDVSPLAVVNVGGGTWSYGSGLSGIFKSCWSNYVHPSRYHSSTAVIANQSVKRYANAGAWSYAQAEAGIAYQCNACWNTY